MYAKGMSTRDIEAHMKDIYGIDVSADLVSKITDKIYPMITEWQSRPLDPVYPIVFLDAIHFKVRKDNRIINKAAYSVLGIDVSGHKDILGIWIGENESASFWLGVCNDLKNRGVEDILIASKDGLSGFSDAINSVFPRTSIQLCVIHQIRNSLKYISYPCGTSMPLYFVFLDLPVKCIPLIPRLSLKANIALPRTPRASMPHIGLIENTLTPRIGSIENILTVL